MTSFKKIVALSFATFMIAAPAFAQPADVTAASVQTPMADVSTSATVNTDTATAPVVKKVHATHKAAAHHVRKAKHVKKAAVESTSSTSTETTPATVSTTTEATVPAAH